MTAGLRKNFMGRKIIVNLFTKHGYRTSPGVSAKAAAIGECAREVGPGKTPEKKAERKECFRTHKNVKNQAGTPNKNK